jgi:hypothetical protein
VYYRGAVKQWPTNSARIRASIKELREADMSRLLQ